MGHHFKPEEPLEETAAVLSYEVGRFLEAAMYLKWGNTFGDPKLIQTLRGQAKSELLDIGAQFILLCESLGMDPQETISLGLEKAGERFSRKDYKHFDLRQREEEIPSSGEY